MVTTPGDWCESEEYSQTGIGGDLWPRAPDGYLLTRAPRQPWSKPCATLSPWSQPGFSGGQRRIDGSHAMSYSGAVRPGGRCLTAETRVLGGRDCGVLRRGVPRAAWRFLRDLSCLCRWQGWPMGCGRDSRLDLTGSRDTARASHHRTCQYRSPGPHLAYKPEGDPAVAGERGPGGRDQWPKLDNTPDLRTSPHFNPPARDQDLHMPHRQPQAPGPPTPHVVASHPKYSAKAGPPCEPRPSRAALGRSKTSDV